MAGGNNVEVHINGDEDVSGAAGRAAAAIDALKGKKITVDIDFDKDKLSKMEKALTDLQKQGKSLGDDVGDFDLNTRKARDKLTYLHEKAKALGDLETEIDVDTRKARDKLTYLHNRHKEIGDNKPELDLDTAKARDKLSYLKSRFSEIFNDQPEVDVNTKKARDKLSKLGSRVKEVISVKQEIDIDTDKAKEKLNGLNKIGKKLKKINIDVDIDDAIDQIEDLYLAMEHLKDKTINIDIDSGQALAQIAALDSALHGMDGRKKVDVDVDVDDTDMMRWQSELDSLNRNKRRIQNNPYELTIPTEIEVDEDRIQELEKRIADKKNTIKVKTELDNSELEDAGIRDKKVKIDVEINGLERLQALRAVIASLEDKTININVNSDSKGIDKLTNSRNGVARPITQSINVDVNERELEEANRQIRRKLAERNARGQSFLDAEIRAAKDNFDNLRRAGKNIRIRLDDEGELARLQKNFDKVTIKIAAAMDRDQLLKDLKNNKKVLEEIPVKIRTQDDNNALRNINKDIKNIQKIKKISIPVETRLQEADKIAKDIDRIFDTRDAAYKGTKIKADADTAAASAKLAALTRPRSVTIQADVDRSALSGVSRLFSNAGNSIRRSFGGDNNRRGSLFGDIVREGKLVGSALGSVGRTVNSGIAAVTRGIPVLGGVARAAASIKSPILSAGVAFAALGSVGVIAGGAAAGGIYLVNAALGAVAGVAGLAGAAIGGLFVGGFAAIAAQSEQVSTAFSNMGTYVSDAMKVIAQPVELPLVRAAQSLQGAFDQMRPSLDRIAVGTGTLIDNLSGKLPAIAGALGPTLEKAFGAGSRHLQTFGNALPSIITGLGKFFDKLGGEGAIAGAQRFYEKLPGIFSAIGTGIDKAGAAFVKVDDFINSGRIDPLKSGIGSFIDKLSNADYSGAITGLSNLANSFGEFAGSINVQGVSDFFGDTMDGLATVTDGFTNAGKTIGDFFTILDAGASGGSSLDQGMRSLIDIADGINGALGGDPNFIKDQIASPDAVDIPFDVNLLPTYNVVGPNGEPALEIPENLFPESETVSTNVGATVDITAIPGAIETDGIQSVVTSGVFDDISSLPPQDAVVKIKALFEMINDGEIQGQFTDEILKGANVQNLPPIETEIAMEAIAQLAVTGVVPPDDLFRSLDALNLNLPPKELEQAIDLIYKLGERGLLTPEQVSGLLGSDGLNLQPIEAEQAVNIKLTLAEAMGIDQGGQDMDTFLNRITSRLSNTNSGPIEISREALLSIDADPNKALDQIKALIGTIRGVPAEDVDITVGANVTLEPRIDTNIPEFGDNAIRDAIQGLVGEGNSEAATIQQNVLLDLQLGLGAAGVGGTDGIADKIKGLVDSAGGGPIEISQELVATLDASLGNPADLDAALDSLFSAIAGKPVDVNIPVKVAAEYDLEPPQFSALQNLIPADLPPQEAVYDVVATLGSFTGEADFAGIVDRVKDMANANGGVVEITTDVEAQFGEIFGLEGAELEAAIEGLLSGLAGKKVDIEIEGEAKFNLLGDPGAQIADAVKSSAASAESAKSTVTPQIDVQPQLNFDGSKIAAGIATGMKATATSAESAKTIITPQIDVSGIAQQLGAISVPPIKVLVQPDLTGFAAILGAIGGSSVGIVKVLVQADLTGFAAILGAINGSTIGTVKVLVIPDLSALGALGAITIPPIRVPIIVDPPIIPSIAVPMLRGTITYDAIIPPINIPNTTSTHTILINNPGLPSFPNTTSTHSIIMNVPSMPSFPNTSSTHTINVVVNGSTSIGGGGGSAKAGAFGDNPLARGIAPMSMGAISPMGAAGISSGGRGVQAIRQTGVDIANNFADGLASGVGAVDKAANELAQAAGQIGPQVDKYLSANSPEYNEAKRIGGEVVGSISQGITDAQGQIGTALNGVNQAFNSALGDADKFLSANVPGYDTAKKQFEGLQKAAAVAGSEFQSIVATEFQLPPIEQILGGAAQLGDGAFKALMGDPTQLNATVDQFGQAFAQKVSSIQTKVGEAMAKVNQTLVDNVPGYAEAQAQVQGFVQGFNDTIGGISEATSFAGGEFQRIMSEEFVLPPMDQVISKAQEIGDGIEAALMGDPTKLAGTMDGIGSTLAAKVTSIQTQVGTAMAGVNQILVDKVPGFAEMQAKGAEIGSGLQAGITDAQAGIASVATTIGTNINNGLAALTIQTPAPIVPAPNTTALDQAVNAIGSIVPPDIIATMMPDFEPLLKITEQEIPKIADGLDPIVVEIGANPSGLSSALNAIGQIASDGVGVSVPITGEFSNLLAAVPELPPVPLPVIPSLEDINSGLAMVGLPPVQIPVTPDLTTLNQGLAAVGIPPLSLPVIPDTTTLAMNLAAIIPPPLAIPTTLNPPVIPPMMIPPIPVDMVVNVPQIPSFPNTSSVHTVNVSAAPLPSYPDTTSINNVNVVAEPLPIYPDTESTHTVKVDAKAMKGIGETKKKKVNAGTRSLSNNAMGSMAGVAGLSSMSMGVPQALNSESISPRGTVGLAIGGLAVGGLLLGLGALFAGLFAILGAFSNNLGKLKPNDIDGGSYRPEGVINHYYYQTTQNNHFDGGLVGDPELQGKRVLEVLQSAPNGRQFRNQLGAST